MFEGSFIQLWKFVVSRFFPRLWLRICDAKGLVQIDASEMFHTTWCLYIMDITLYFNVWVICFSNLDSITYQIKSPEGVTLYFVLDQWISFTLSWSDIPKLFDQWRYHLCSFDHFHLTMKVCIIKDLSEKLWQHNYVTEGRPSFKTIPPKFFGT